MVIIPKGKDKEAAEKILYEGTFTKSSPDLQLLVWIDKKRYIKWVVGYNNHKQDTLQIHITSVLGCRYTPRELLVSMFDYPFNVVGVNMLIGVVNGLNKDVIEFAKRLNFIEINRFEKMHANGGDIVTLVLPKQKCKFI